MSFYIGCAVWAYKDWVGDFYPANSRPSDFLNLYSQRLTSVEGNTTFYSFPSEATVLRWKAATPSSFKFCLKLPREITHQGSLMPYWTQAIAFVNRVRILGERLGPMLVQLPPSYSPAQMQDLVTFLTAWPRANLPIAVEVRHPDWFRSPHAEALEEKLRELGVGKVLLDSRPIYDCPDNPQLASERKKPQVPLQPIVTQNFSIIRYISHPDWELNRDYLASWVTQLQSWLSQGLDIYFFVHCPIEARSPGFVRQFQHQLERAGIEVPPLPWDIVKQEESAQLSLFSD